MANVNELLQRIRRYWKYYWSAISRYQAHSPFVFDFFVQVLDDDRRYYAFDEIENLRKRMITSGGHVDVEDHGTGKSGRVKMRDLAKTTACTPSKGRRLFRIVQWRQPKTILELGTSLGVGTAYLASGNTRAKTYTIEGAPELSAIAKAHMELLRLDQSVEVITGPFEEVLPGLLPKIGKVDLIYLDGNHRKAPTLDYMNRCRPFLSPDGLMVFDDIHMSEEMDAAWKAICAHPGVRLSLDCFDIGLVSFSEQFREKQHFSLIPLQHKPWRMFF